jgi:transcriptional regulator with XRE-family HTH domain
MAAQEARRSSSILEDGASRRLGERIRELRQRRGLTLDQLAARSDVSRSMLSNVERGVNNPTLVAAVRIAEALGVGIAGLIGDGERRAPVVARASDAAVFVDPTGYERHLFPAFEDAEVELVRHVVPPGVRSEELGAQAPMDKYLVVEAGAVRVDMDGAEHDLGPGDAIALPARSVYRFANTADETARFLLVKLPHRG